MAYPWSTLGTFAPAAASERVVALALCGVFPFDAPLVSLPTRIHSFRPPFRAGERIPFARCSAPPLPTLALLLQVTIVSHLAEEFDWHAAPPKVRKEGEADSDDDEDIVGEAGEQDTAGGASEQDTTEGGAGENAARGGAAGAGSSAGGAGAAPQPMQAEAATGGARLHPGRPALGGPAAVVPIAGSGRSIFGSVQTLAERAQGQRAPKRGKKERVLPPRKKIAVDDEARYNPQVRPPAWGPKADAPKIAEKPSVAASARPAHASASRGRILALPSLVRSAAVIRPRLGRESGGERWWTQCREVTRSAEAG